MEQTSLPKHLAKVLRRSSPEGEVKQVPVKLGLNSVGGANVRPAPTPMAITPAKDAQHSPLVVAKISHLSNSAVKSLRRSSSESDEKEATVQLELNGLGGVKICPAPTPKVVTSAKNVPEASPRSSVVRKISRLSNSVTKSLGRSSSDEKKQVSAKLEPRGPGSVRVLTSSPSNAVTPAKHALEAPLDRLAVGRISRLPSRVGKHLRRLSSKGSKSPPSSGQAPRDLSGEGKSRRVTFAEGTNFARKGRPVPRRRRVVRPPLLLTLPDNVLYIIRNRLSLSGANFLSLVCKRFYAVLNPDLRGLDLGKHRESFLKRLENDAPHKIVYCSFCSRVHPIPISTEPRCAFGATRAAGCGGRSWSYHIDWPFVRAITNCHFLIRGGARRPSELGPFRLHLHRHWTGAWPGWQTFRHGRIIGGELYLRNFHRLIPRQNQGGRPADINSAPADERDVCEHLVSGSVEYYKTQYLSRARESRRYKSESGQSCLGESWITEEKAPCPVQKRRGSCEICYTDYSRVTMEDNDKGAWAVYVCTFQRLGSGRVANELPWVCGSSLECSSKVPTRRMAGDRYNSIRDTWMRDEDQDDFQD